MKFKRIKDLREDNDKLQKEMEFKENLTKSMIKSKKEHNVK